MAKKILIVDDSPSVLAILEDMLDELGYEAATATNGKQACQLLETTRYDLIITDLTMPSYGRHYLCADRKADAKL